jgi:hypothetical protein
MSKYAERLAAIAYVIDRNDAQIVLDVLQQANIECEVSGEGPLSARSSGASLLGFAFPTGAMGGAVAGTLTILVKEKDIEASEKALADHNAKQ